MYPKTELGPFGYNPVEYRFPINRFATLGYVLSPLRRTTVIEKWTPLEIAVFEGSLTLYGKNFNQIQKDVSTPM